MQTRIYEIFDADYMVKLQTQFYAEFMPNSCAAYMIRNSEPLRIFEIAVEGIAVGFIGIRNAARDWYLGPRLNGAQAWCAEIAYIKPAYRHKGLQRELLSYVMEHENVQVVCLEEWRLDKHQQYFGSLGFTNAVRFHDMLNYVATPSIWTILGPAIAATSY